MSQHRRRRMLQLGALSCISSVLTAEDYFIGRPLKNRCCLPSHDYVTDGFSLPVTGQSLSPVKAVPATSSMRTGQFTEQRHRDELMAPDTLLIKVFQIRPASLIADHCTVSQIAVTLSDSGDWFLSCSATQNPAAVEATRRTEFERFLRNQFRLQVRPVLIISGDSPVKPGDGGLPEVECIEDQTFWVRKGEQRKLALSGTSDRLATLFEQVERVQIHFSYR